jgi:hypothetical protein
MKNRGWLCYIFLIINFSFFIPQTLLLGFQVNDTLPLSKGHFLQLGLSCGSFAVRDYETSALVYHGCLPGVQAGMTFYGKKMLTLFEFNFSHGHQVTRNYPSTDDNRALSYNSNLEFGVAVNLSSPKLSKTSVFLGGYFGLLANFRNNAKFNNANFNYEGIASVGPLVRVEKEMKGPFSNHIIKFSTMLVVPVINGLARPPYPAIDDFVDGVSPEFKLKKTEVISFDHFFSLRSQTDLGYYFQNGNRFMLSYHWYNYNYYRSVNKLRSVAGYFSLSFSLRLNKSKR